MWAEEDGGVSRSAGIPPFIVTLHPFVKLLKSDVNYLHNLLPTGPSILQPNCKVAEYVLLKDVKIRRLTFRWYKIQWAVLELISKILFSIG